MKAWPVGWMLAAAVCLALGTGVSAGAEAGAEKPEGTAPSEKDSEAKVPEKTRSISEAERSRVEKQLTVGGEKLAALQEEELALSIKIATIEGKALERVEDKKKLKNSLAKGINSPEVAGYRNTMLACVQQWQMTENKYAAVLRSLRHLDQRRHEMPEDLKSRTEELMARILKSRRSCLEKIAAIYEKLMDDKMMLATYVAIYQMLPEDQREADAALKEKILALKKKLEPEKDKADTKKNGEKKQWR